MKKNYDRNVVNNIFSYQYLRASRDLDNVKFPFTFYNSRFLGERCNSVLLRSSRNVLWIIKLHLTFHQHEGEQTVTEFFAVGWAHLLRDIACVWTCFHLQHFGMRPLSALSECYFNLVWAFAVKFQKCFVYNKTSLNFVSTWGWVYNDRIFIFEWTVPLNMRLLWLCLTYETVKQSIWTVDRIGQAIWTCDSSGAALFAAQNVFSEYRTIHF